jgi:hypothetical protein
MNLITIQLMDFIPARRCRLGGALIAAGFGMVAAVVGMAACTGAVLMAACVGAGIVDILPVRV